MANLYFQHHYSSLQCHMILQKSFKYADLLLKNFLFIYKKLYFYSIKLLFSFSPLAYDLLCMSPMAKVCKDAVLDFTDSQWIIFA